MKCPHCKVGIAENFSRTGLPQYPTKVSLNRNQTSTVDWTVLHQRCPECAEFIIFLEKREQSGQGPVLISGQLTAYPHVPNGVRDIAPGVTSPYRDDFREACIVLPFSAKASAALSRRCLQVMLREVAKVKHSDLSKEIDEVLNSRSLPSHLAEAIDAIRNIGNFAAHPIKSTNTGEIVDVEPGEAEWLLDVLEGLFDFYFVQPAVLQKKLDALNKKLAEAGKPVMK